MTWTEKIGPFDPKAETCQCVIWTPTKPNHFKVLWCFTSVNECETAFNLWKDGK
jgi:hypothetical protein